jgi:c-di-GMP-related signal transduction protein
VFNRTAGEANGCQRKAILGRNASIKNVESLLRQREKNAYDSFIGNDKGYVQVMLEQAKRQENSYLDVDARRCR